MRESTDNSVAKAVAVVVCIFRNSTHSGPFKSRIKGSSDLGF